MRCLQKKIQLYRQQAEFRNSTALYRAFVGGISTGKSYVGAYDLIRRARRGRTYMAVGPTYTSLQDSTLKSFLSVARELGVVDSKLLRLSAPPQLTLTTGAQILFRSGDRPEMLRGPNLSGVWLDEASLMPRLVYDISIGRLRECGEQGWLSTTFTPKGPTHWTYELFADGGPDRELFRAKTSDNPFNPPGFAGTLLKQYGDVPFARQELGGEFVQVDGAVFPAEWFQFPGFLCDWPEGITHEVLYLDPSQGKDAKANDFQAYVRAGFWPGQKHENLIYLDCVVTKEPPPDMVARGVRLCKDRRPGLWAYETNGTMGLLAAEIDRQCRENNLLVRTWPVTNTDPKRWRIRNTLMPYLSQKRIRIRDTAGGKTLKAQLMDEPFPEHDDCSDAAAGAITLLESLVGA